MWPFRKKRQLMTSDVAASAFSDEIKVGMEPYTIALDRFAITHDNDDEIKQLMGELWIFNITILDYLWSIIEFPETLRDKILPMIIVGYAKVDHKHYIERAHYYGERISNVSSETETIAAGNALAELIDTEYFGYKEPNGKKLFAGTVSVLAIETMKKLSVVTFDLQVKYEIVP